MGLTPSPANVSVIGAGTMGRGIAQVAATAGHNVTLIDADAAALDAATGAIDASLERQLARDRIDADHAASIRARLTTDADVGSARHAGLVVEAIVEDLAAKQSLFAALEHAVGESCILATNTSSLSVTALASACRVPGRVIGTHFFNPATRMKLVEVVPGLRTDEWVVNEARSIVDRWEKATVLAKDTPGFIVNRVARPFYGEALRILEEGIADVPTIDWAMRERGGFKMGPFELMDLVGTDVSLATTRGMYESSFHEPRYRPAITQLRMVEAGRLGRKSGHGYYDHTDGAPAPVAKRDGKLAKGIFVRILALLINEAADAVLYGIGDATDIDRAVTLGLNFPKGLLRWCDDLGVRQVLKWLTALHHEYGEDRYRPSAQLRRMSREKRRFFP